MNIMKSWHLTCAKRCNRFLLKDLEQGLSIMRDKTEEYGKIMIEMR